MTAARRVIAGVIVLIVIGVSPVATGRGGMGNSDHPWNPEHISRLPKEVTRTLARLCISPPNAGHYFATYFENSRLISLHYEHVHCQTRQPLCTQAGCLHELYVLDGIRYRLLRSFYGTRND
jgi:hypothetical protein